MTEILKTWRTVYKLTDANGQTRGGTQWGPNVTNPCGTLSGAGGLCSGGFYHGYHTPELAAFLNPIHADIPSPRFWLAEIRGVVETDRGHLKLGATEMRVVRELPAIVPTIRQRQVFAIYCARSALSTVGLDIPAWTIWAAAVLSGTSSSDAAVNAVNAVNAANAAYSAANYAASDAAVAAVAAYYAANASYSAANAASDAAIYAMLPEGTPAPATTTEDRR